MMKKYKIFLASSTELALERKEIALMITRLNNKWIDKAVYLELVIWEDLLHSFRGERIQDYFNQEMLKCDIMIVLFFKKVGQFTEEEFKLAYEKLKAGEKPNLLFVFFKKFSIDIDDIDDDILRIRELKKELQENEQIYGTFHSNEDLVLKLQHQLEHALYHQQGAIIKGDKMDTEEMALYDLKNYNQHLDRKFKYLDFTGLNAILQSPLLLEDIYVKLRVKKSLPFERFYTIEDFERLVEKKKEEGEYKEEDFVILFKRLYRQKQKEQQPLRMLILGYPGSGKTTLMKWITLQCLKDKKNFFSEFIPVFLYLKDLGSEPDNTYRSKNIGDLSIELLEKENISIDSFFERQFKANRLLFLLDGLDDIGDENKRREMIHWIQMQYIGQNSLIVTSRFSALNQAERLKFRDEIPVFSVQDFKMADMEAFLQKWYQNVEIALAGAQGTQRAIEEGEKKYRDLIAIIKDDRYKNLKELAVNPLLLTIIAIVHRTRAVLPRDRYKLYEECLEVMIRLWNQANRKVGISFSFENSIFYLSKIAARLMETNRREIDKTEIEESCLTDNIEGQTREFFLKEMVQKAGLLYESEGMYGFLHLTFQEYLAAWYFSKSKNQNDILQHWDKDYWRETFKLFVNIGNAELFFDKIKDGLLKKKYRKNMVFLEECIEEIVREETKKSIELRFGEKVADILLNLEYKKENEELIDELFLHYPLYKQAQHLVKQGWNLFNNAKHPFVQSIGTSILNRADYKSRAELMIQLKHRIESFEKQADESDNAFLNFLLQNNNNFLLHFWGRQNLMDFHFMLTKLKSKRIFLQFLALRCIQGILDFRGTRKKRYILDILDVMDIQYIQGILNIKHAEKVLDILSIQIGTLSPFEIRDLRDLRQIKIDRIFGFIIYSQRIRYLKKIIEDYNSEYKSILKKNQREIAEWVNRVIEKLLGMSDKSLLKYFPNTPIEELKAFRESYGKKIK